MKLERIIPVMLLALALAGCSTNNPATTKPGAAPTPAQSEYLVTQGGGFVFTRGADKSFQSCRYVVVVGPNKALDKPLFLRTRFENPSDASNPLVIDSEMPPGRLSFNVESPPVRGLHARQSYKMEILIFASPERTHSIGQHIQYVQSQVAF